jgi:hypothetical protein
MCIIKGCKNVKTYNLVGLEAQYCGDHKSDDMINTRHERCTECRFQASFGYIELNQREKCSIHKLDGMINLKHKNINCIGHLCEEARVPNMNGYCSQKCYIGNNLQEYIYNDNSGILYKEYLIFKHLKETYTYNIIWNKIYCGQYRPDFHISFPTFSILIEIDEYQHKTYNKKNEHDRIENIYHMVNKPLYIIRFNPDAYDSVAPQSGASQPRWGKGLSPFCNGKIINEDEWNHRLNQLNYTVNTCIDGKLPDTYKIIYLFYNEN